MPWVSGSDAVFGGAPGTVDVDGLRFNSITFNSAYALQVLPDLLSIHYPPFVLEGGVVDVAHSDLDIHFDSAKYSVSGKFIKEGPGTLTVYGERQGASPIVINEGTLASLGSLSSTSVTIGSGATWRVLSAPFHVVIPPLSGAGSLHAEAMLDLSDTTNLQNFTGAIIIANGVGLGGDLANSLTIIDQGVVRTSSAAPNAGALTLDGGKIALGRQDLQAGLLRVADLTFSRGEFEFDLESSTKHDQLEVTGSVLLKGPIALSINLAVDPVDFVDVYRLVLNDGTDITSVFDDASRFIYQGNVLEEGETFLATSGELSQYFQIYYGLTAEDNDIRLLAAPEPGSVAMLVIGALCLLGRRERRRAA